MTSLQRFCSFCLLQEAVTAHFHSTFHSVGRFGASHLVFRHDWQLWDLTMTSLPLSCFVSFFGLSPFPFDAFCLSSIHVWLSSTSPGSSLSPSPWKLKERMQCNRTYTYTHTHTQTLYTFFYSISFIHPTLYTFVALPSERHSLGPLVTDSSTSYYAKFSQAIAPCDLLSLKDWDCTLSHMPIILLGKASWALHGSLFCFGDVKIDIFCSFFGF